MEFCGNSTGINELIVDGLPANVGTGIVPLFCLSSLVNKVPVPSACGTGPCSFCGARKGEFLGDDLGVDQTWKIDYLKHFPVIQMYSLCQEAIVSRGSAWNENLESSQVDWKRLTISHCNLIPILEILLNYSWNSSVLAFPATEK